EVITQRNLRDEILGIGGTRNEPGAAPRIVFGDFAALHLGGAEVQMLSLGRGHTAGDTYVYFPDLKVVHTGDAVIDPAPYCKLSHALCFLAFLARCTFIPHISGYPDHGCYAEHRQNNRESQWHGFPPL